MFILSVKDFLSGVEIVIEAIYSFYSRPSLDIMWVFSFPPLLLLTPKRKFRLLPICLCIDENCTEKNVTGDGKR